MSRKQKKRARARTLSGSQQTRGGDELFTDALANRLEQGNQPERERYTNYDRFQYACARVPRGLFMIALALFSVLGCFEMTEKTRNTSVLDSKIPTCS